MAVLQRVCHFCMQNQASVITEPHRLVFTDTSRVTNISSNPDSSQQSESPINIYCVRPWNRMRHRQSCQLKMPHSQLPAKDVGHAVVPEGFDPSQPPSARPRDVSGQSTRTVRSAGTVAPPQTVPVSWHLQVFMNTMIGHYILHTNTLDPAASERAASDLAASDWAALDLASSDPYCQGTELHCTSQEK